MPRWYLELHTMNRDKSTAYTQGYLECTLSQLSFRLRCCPRLTCSWAFACGRWAWCPRRAPCRPWCSSRPPRSPPSWRPLLQVKKSNRISWCISCASLPWLFLAFGHLVSNSTLRISRIFLISRLEAYLNQYHCMSLSKPTFAISQFTVRESWGWFVQVGGQSAEKLRAKNAMWGIKDFIFQPGCNFKGIINPCPLLPPQAGTGPCPAKWPGGGRSGKSEVEDAVAAATTSVSWVGY